MKKVIAPPASGEKQAWTEERVSQLRKLWLEGLSASTIAGKLGQGVTRNAVIGKVHRIGLAGRAAGPNARQTEKVTGKIRSEPAATAAPSRPPTPMPLQGAGATALKQVVRLEPKPIAQAAPQPLRIVSIADKSGRITILQLTEKTCKWPIGDPGHDDFCFCGHNPRENTPYCDFHARMAYQPAQDRNRRRFG